MNRSIVSIIINELFQVSLLTYILLLLADLLTNNLVSLAVRPDILLYLIIPTGILQIFLPPEKPIQHLTAVQLWSKMYRTFLSFLAGGVVYHQLKSLGLESLLGAYLAAVSSYVLLFLIDTAD